MANKNYQAGRRFEYTIKKALEGNGWEVFRTAGSHGSYDLIALQTADESSPNVVCIQCKVVATEAAGERAKKAFLKNRVSNLGYEQVIYVKVKRGAISHRIVGL